MNKEMIRVYYENKENSENRNKISIKVKNRKEQENQDKVNKGNKNKQRKRDATVLKENRNEKFETWKMGSWNVQAINGKELLEEFERNKLRLLGITETKKEGKGNILIEQGHILIWWKGPERENGGWSGNNK
ncbi:hypothetical protein Zmor_021714 [Zophobas morio]|uniref:Uncharacterized protein n=1 Tax=Zophobas morio TaxID=2755281 RepID=A0AA38MBE3_9CUCU|nr:hypothetical protein Zmor_021714 [Zophobas morio]